MVVNVEFVRHEIIGLEVSNDYKLLRHDSPMGLFSDERGNLQAQLIEKCYAQIPEDCDIVRIDDAIDNDAFYEA